MSSVYEEEESVAHTEENWGWALCLCVLQTPQ